MRVITKISTQKRNKARFNIFINDQYAFSVSEDVLVKYNLHKGMELVDDKVVQLLEADSLQKSYILAIHYLSYRMRSVKEVYDYLIKKEVSEHDAEKVVVKLLNEKLLDDATFARAFITDQMNQTTKGPALIKRDLLRKGVNEQIATEMLTMFTFDIQYEKALRWAERRIRRTSKDSYRKRIEKLRHGLMNRGFFHDVIQEVIMAVEDDIIDGTEWAVLQTQANKLYNRFSKRYSNRELINRVKSGLYNRGFPRELIDRYINEVINDE